MTPWCVEVSNSTVMDNLGQNSLSHKIANMSLICSILIVCYHVDWGRGWMNSFVGMRGLAGTCVPFFFIVSGYFLAKHFDEEGWWRREIGKRVRTLLVPWLLWTIIALALLIPCGLIAVKLTGKPLLKPMRLSDPFWWGKMFGLDIRYGGGAIGALWYLRCLFLMVVLSPIFDWFVRKGRVLWIATLYLLCLLFFCFGGRFRIWIIFQFWLSVTGIFYFSLGIYLRRVKRRDVSGMLALGCGVVGFGLLVSRDCINYSFPFHFLATPFLICFMWGLISARQWPRWLVSCAFPIFLTHQLLFSLLALFAVDQHFPSAIYPWILWCLGVMIPIAFSVWGKRAFPDVAKILLGGR